MRRGATLAIVGVAKLGVKRLVLVLVVLVPDLLIVTIPSRSDQIGLVPRAYELARCVRIITG